MKKLEALSAEEREANEAFGCWLCREDATHRGFYRVGYSSVTILEKLLCPTHAHRFAERQGIDVPKIAEMARG